MTQPDGVRTVIDRDPTGRIVGVRDDVGRARGHPESGRPSSTSPVGSCSAPTARCTATTMPAGWPRSPHPTATTWPSSTAPTGLIATEHRVGITRHFAYDDAGRVAEITVDGGLSTRFGTTTPDGESGEVRSDGTELHFGWSGLDRLTEIVRVAPGGERVRISIEVDALGRPRRVGGQAVDYDPLTSLPSRIGEDAHRQPAGAGVAIRRASVEPHPTRRFPRG